MTERPRRERRETAEAVFGVGGFAPHPARGPVTALRVLGQGFEIPTDPSRAERGWATVGARLTVKGLPVLALDELTRQVIEAELAGVQVGDDLELGRCGDRGGAVPGPGRRRAGRAASRTDPVDVKSKLLQTRRSRSEAWRRCQRRIEGPCCFG